ncbi:MAG: EutN/CcmL family microcompartment protein [Clostridiales Family XIII bacterium]|jgi:microcompartment protein CcmK/EutM|nr:EutN/CcmL family microcompartment protein [Clostridiales Family XIII bacterium]
MRLATVVGNVVSTIKDDSFQGYKLMIVEFIDEKGASKGARQIAFDAADAGVGDVVLVNVDGGAANMLLDKDIIADYTICGVIDHISYEGNVTEYL